MIVKTHAWSTCNPTGQVRLSEGMGQIWRHPSRLLGVTAALHCPLCAHAYGNDHKKMRYLDLVQLIYEIFQQNTCL